MPQGTQSLPPFAVSSAPGMRPSSRQTAVAEQEIVLCDVAGAFARFIYALSKQFRVTVASTVGEAIASIDRTRPALAVTHTKAGDAGGLAFCAAAKRASAPVTVLVTTPDPSAVPDALKAGCDGVLLEPFPPNLLYARIGRLMREQSLSAKTSAALRQRSLAASAAPARGTNRFWPKEICPMCQVLGVTSFEFHSHRRAWFACTQCSHVWVARRLDP